MFCKICKSDHREEIENLLSMNNGSLNASDLTQYDLTAQECSIHFNFHQAIQKTKEIEETLANDVGKDEADTLYQLLNQQAATMTLLNNKINKVLKENGDELNTMLIHPQVAQFYNELGESMRKTVGEIRNLNAAVNGSKDSAFEGLKALANAIGESTSHSEADLTTTMYDD